MEFDREALENLLNQKLQSAERSIIRNYLIKCGVSSDDIAVMTEEFVSERAQRNAEVSAELENARQAITELESKLKAQTVDFIVRDAMLNAGVKSKHYADVRKLAEEQINLAVTGEGNIDTEAITSAISELVARIPYFAEDVQGSALRFTGSRGNFARNDDNASVLKNRLNTARAAGNNALSVSIISEAAEMGISLR